MHYSSLVKIMFAPLPKGVSLALALERFPDLDCVLALKFDLGPQNPTFVPWYKIY